MRIAFSPRFTIRLNEVFQLLYPVTKDACGHCVAIRIQTIKTLLHEIAHSLLHNPEEMEERKVRRDTKEVEAESTAFIVATLLGLDTSDYSFEYIAGWNGKDNLKALSAAMKQVQDTANQMYENILQQLDSVA